MFQAIRYRLLVFNDSVNNFMQMLDFFIKSISLKDVN